jgi:hypothetical protein
MTNLSTRDLGRHTALLGLLVPSVAILFVLCSTCFAVAQPQSCSNADGKQYAEGSRLGPFKCQGGQWIYVGE